MHTMRALALFALVAASLAVSGSALAAVPPNDDHMAATELFGRVDFAEGTNVDATKAPDEPDHAGNPGGASIWYRWVAPAAGEATVSTCDSGFDTLLAVYEGIGPLSLLDEVASSDDDCNEQSRVQFAAVSGTTYLIAVDGADGATGTVFLSLGLAPPNDDFAAAEELAGDNGSRGGTTVGASSEDQEPMHGGRNSVWFSWTAPSSGWATFYTCGSPFDTVLAVYTGDALEQLALVAVNDDGCGYASRLSFEATAGTVYGIAVSGFSGETGDFTLNWNRFAPPPTPVRDPQVHGVAVDGETLTASEGEWSGAPPFTFTYAWGRCDRDVEECEYIPGATSKTFIIRSVDVGYRLWVRIVAANATGPTEAFSDVTSVVAARPPANTSPPVVEGEGRLGAILVASPGSWLGTAPISYAYQWQTCESTSTSCSNIQGQTGQVMRVSSVENGDLIRVVVTASNVAGSASAASSGTDVERTVTAKPRRCVVPSLRGKTLRSARSAIRRNRCRVGRVQRRFSASVKSGRVISQTPRAGRRLAVGAKVHVLVSKGKRR